MSKIKKMSKIGLRKSGDVREARKVLVRVLRLELDSEDEQNWVVLVRRG